MGRTHGLHFGVYDLTRKKGVEGLGDEVVAHKSNGPSSVAQTLEYSCFEGLAFSETSKEALAL